MKITKEQLKKIIMEELENVSRGRSLDEYEDWPSEQPGHPAVVKANDALHEAYLAVVDLADIIQEQPDSVSDMAHAEPSLADVTSKIANLGHLTKSLTGR
tara:strand:- start:648 stop:947 length:300 start_codon:yes stop_codon:yes gene_type:complete